ncbi:DUF2218 domain-containing protein [Pseudomonas indica]|jgi:hypothetical protein|uniref:DUF2218 domain-containing protein n=1 Tax=Pseudomonas indica TaxID=137658 RepID=UPI0023F855B1|nr:DUF2218 domain-containing protein [Pseudomonas indica]MBU3055429.1 DUF2218 domain-containing protein [Pseudomonas indica]
MSLNAIAHVPTDTPGRYIGRLCKHFAHKLPVSHDDTSGRIEFDGGVCLLKAENQGLSLRVESAREETLERLKQVVASHFERFAWQEALQLDWQ